eukprot:3153859-Amphidinium_carterae.1
MSVQETATITTVRDQFQAMQVQVQQQNAELQRQATELQHAQAQAKLLWAQLLWRASAEWRHWSSQFCVFVGVMHGGQVGKWQEAVEQSRSNSAFKVCLGRGQPVHAATLHSALIQVVEGRAFVIVDRSGGGEGLETWRKLKG